MMGVLIGLPSHPCICILDPRAIRIDHLDRNTSCFSLPSYTISVSVITALLQCDQPSHICNQKLKGMEEGMESLGQRAASPVSIPSFIKLQRRKYTVFILVVFQNHRICTAYTAIDSCLPWKNPLKMMSFSACDARLSCLVLPTPAS